MKSLKLALVADLVTRSCLVHECEIIDIPAKGFRSILQHTKPDLLLVESAWHGIEDSWRFKVPTYRGRIFRSNRAVKKLASCARDMGIPTVFWNKEDGIHFPRFIDSAKQFEHVFTVDSSCVERYREVMGEDASVHVLPFPVQPKNHNFTGFDFKENNANFAGSFSHHIHPRRREWQLMAFEAALESGLGLTIYDRNSNRPSQIYRYPDLPELDLRPAVPPTETAQIYKRHLVSLNVNTITDSETMYSRRLIEILACGGIVVSSPALSIEKMFKDYCHVVRNGNEAHELFSRLRHGPTADDLARARAGAEHVIREHNWAKGLEKIVSVAGL